MLRALTYRKRRIALVAIAAILAATFVSVDSLDPRSSAAAVAGSERCVNPFLASSAAGWSGGGGRVPDSDDARFAHAYRSGAPTGVLAYLPELFGLHAGERLDLDVEVLSTALGQVRLSIDWYRGTPSQSTYLGSERGPSVETGIERSYVIVRAPVVVPPEAVAAHVTVYGDGFPAGTTHLLAGCHYRTPDPCARPLSAAALSQHSWGVLTGRSDGMTSWNRLSVRSSARSAMVWAPEVVVAEGEQWMFALPVASNRVVTARVNVSWLDPTTDPPTYRSTTYGQPVVLARGGFERMVSVTATVPDVVRSNEAPGAGVLARVVVVAEMADGGDLYLGDCRYSRDGTSRSAASRLGWGAPIPAASDEFAGSSIDSERWMLPLSQAEGCWPGHGANATFGGNGKRCLDNISVDSGTMTLTGTSGQGDAATSGWLGSKHRAQYGRWEARVRTRTIDDAGNTVAAWGPENQYRSIMLLWPTTGWPDGGEYDIFEPHYPGADCAVAFGHYPHPPSVGTQQEYFLEQDCGAPLSEWHIISFEWTPEHLRGFIDGVEVYRWSDGAKHDADGNLIRRNIQDMPEARLTIQLDNVLFDATKQNQPAQFEVDWVRVYGV